MDDDTPPWLLHGFPVITEHLEGYVGFVYIVHNLNNNRRYVGKKLLSKAKTRIVKGKRKRSRVPSDWKNYWGSSAELLADVTLLGKDRFMREIIHLCKNKAELTYLELREQIDRRVLERDDYYNNWIYVRVRKIHLKLSS